MGKFSDVVDSTRPEAYFNRRMRDLERQVREQAAAKRTRFADIGDDYTMTPEGPRPVAPMPLPDGISIDVGTEEIKFVWSGSASSQIPTDFGRLAIHASKFPGYTPTQGTEVATISSPYGGTALYAADGGDTYYIRCAIASLRGDYGPFTDEVAVVPKVGADAETFRGDVVGRSIAIAATPTSATSESFSGTTFPTGWTASSWDNAPGVRASAEVVSSGVPAGSDNGSALKFSYPAGTGSTATADTGLIDTGTPDVANAGVLIRFAPSNLLSAYIGSLWVVLRHTEQAGNPELPPDGIILDVRREFPRVEVRSGGSFVQYVDLNHRIDSTEWRWARLRVIGSRIEAAVWVDGEPEPDPVLATTTAVESGGAAIWWQGLDLTSSAQDVYFDSVDVETFASGFTVANDGTARMSSAQIGNLTVTGTLDAPTARQSGQVVITPSAANTPTKVTVTFDTPFPSTPVGYATAQTVVPGTTVTGASVANITATGMDVYVTRSNTTATTVNWRAELPTQ